MLMCDDYHSQSQKSDILSFYYSDVRIFRTSSTSYARMGIHHWTSLIGAIWHDWSK